MPADQFSQVREICTGAGEGAASAMRRRLRGMTVAGLALMLVLLDGGAASGQSVRETGRINRDWQEACEPVSGGREICFIFQQLLSKGRPAANFSVGFMNGPGAPVAVALLPLGVLLLPEGVRIQTDRGVDGWMAFKSCDLKGCHAEAELSPELLRSMQAGSDAAIVVRTLANEEVRMQLSLRGFTAGLAGLPR